MRGGMSMPEFNEGAPVRTGRRVVLPIADVMDSDWYQYDKRTRHWYEEPYYRRARREPVYERPRYYP